MRRVGIAGVAVAGILTDDGIALAYGVARARGIADFAVQPTAALEQEARRPGIRQAQVEADGVVLMVGSVAFLGDADDFAMGGQAACRGAVVGRSNAGRWIGKGNGLMGQGRARRLTGGGGMRQRRGHQDGKGGQKAVSGCSGFHNMPFPFWRPLF